MAKPNMDDYIDVAERIRLFTAKHPQGSLRPLDPANPYRIEHIGDQALITYVAAAYRTPDDLAPGVGSASEPFPGLTSFTKNSELMNAETSAWGRAIVAVLAADAKKIASAEEVRNRSEEAALPESPATVRADIAAIGKRLTPPLDPAAIGADFTEWHAEHGDIKQADLNTLRMYRAKLQAEL